MQQVLVAFRDGTACEKVRDILESSGEFICQFCQDKTQVRQAIYELQPALVVCGFQLNGRDCEQMFRDIPRQCSVLMVAAGGAHSDGC